MPTSFREGDRLYLFSVYCGLGESRGAPIHLTDEACKRHDEMYQDMLDKGQNPYTTWNYADREFIRELETIGVTTSWREYVVNTVARNLFALKKTILDYGDVTQEPAVAAQPAIEQATADMGRQEERRAQIRGRNIREAKQDERRRKTPSRPDEEMKEAEDPELAQQREVENLIHEADNMIHENEFESLDELIAEHGDELEAMVDVVRDEEVPDLLDLIPEEDRRHHRGRSFINLPDGTQVLGS